MKRNRIEAIESYVLLSIYVLSTIIALILRPTFFTLVLIPAAYFMLGWQANLLWKIRADDYESGEDEYSATLLDYLFSFPPLLFFLLLLTNVLYGNT